MNEDTALRKLFHEHLHADQDGAPDFDRIWSGAIAQRRRRRVLLVFASSGALLLTLASMFVHSGRNETLTTAPDEPLPWRSQVLLTEWRSPTDSLLPSDFH